MYILLWFFNKIEDINKDIFDRLEAEYEVIEKQTATTTELLSGNNVLEIDNLDNLATSVVFGDNKKDQEIKEVIEKRSFSGSSVESVGLVNTDKEKLEFVSQVLLETQPSLKIYAALREDDPMNHLMGVKFVIPFMMGSLLAIFINITF